MTTIIDLMSKDRVKLYKTLIEAIYTNRTYLAMKYRIYGDGRRRGFPSFVEDPQFYFLGWTGCDLRKIPNEIWEKLDEFLQTEYNRITRGKLTTLLFPKKRVGK
jgi:hypothetical protein